MSGISCSSSSGEANFLCVGWEVTELLFFVSPHSSRILCREFGKVDKPLLLGSKELSVQRVSCVLHHRAESTAWSTSGFCLPQQNRDRCVSSVCVQCTESGAGMMFVG